MAHRLNLPPRLLTLLEGESLVNDATALVAYRFGVAAVVTGTFSLREAGGRLVVVTLGGIAVGLIVGFLLLWPLLCPSAVADTPRQGNSYDRTRIQGTCAP